MGARVAVVVGVAKAGSSGHLSEVPADVAKSTGRAGVTNPSVPEMLGGARKSPEQELAKAQPQQAQEKSSPVVLHPHC